MLDDVAAYLLLAPLAASVVTLAAAALWLSSGWRAGARLRLRSGRRRRPF